MEGAMEMPVIRVTDATWERMKRHARPLEDTADDIVKRALDALEGVVGEAKKRAAGPGRAARAQLGQKLPQKEFREPLLLTLEALKGSGSLDEVREAIYPRVEAKLRSADHKIVSTGEPRWW